MRTGKVHYIGVSNVLGWQLQKIADVNKKFGYPQIVSLQVEHCTLDEVYVLLEYVISHYRHNTVYCVEKLNGN